MKTGVRLIVCCGSGKESAALLEKAKEVGWIFNGVNPYPVLIFGKWFTYSEHTSVLHSPVTFSLDKEGWPVMQLAGNEAEIYEILGISTPEPEPIMDESPPPWYTLTPDQEEETRLKFNLSEEQWENTTLPVRLALSGAKVEIKQESITAEWQRLDTVEPDSYMSIIVSAIDRPADSAGSCAIACHYGDGLRIVVGRKDLNYQYWMYLPNIRNE